MARKVWLDCVFQGNPQGDWEICGKSVGNLESWTEMTELLLMLQLVLS